MNLDMTSVFLPLATGAAAVVYASIALGSLFVALVAQRPTRLLRVAAWSGGLAAACVLCTASMMLIDFPSVNGGLVRLLLWLWVALFLSGIGLIVWRGRRSI